MVDGDNKELIEVLKYIEKQLGDIKYDLADIKIPGGSHTLTN